MDNLTEEKLRYRFCKDMNLPIRVFSDSVFFDRLELLDDLYNCKDAYDRFIREVESYNNAQDYFEEYNAVKDKAIEYIKGQEAYNRFNNCDMNAFASKFKGLPAKDIYKPTFDGKTFISIDMKCANFSSLRFYDSSIFGGKNTWEEFLGMFTDNQHILNSKYVRQVVLGNCNPKRHITYEKYLMSMLLERVLECSDLLNEIVFFSNDEVIFDVSEYNDTERHKILDELASVTSRFDVPTETVMFRLGKIDGCDGYIRYFDDETYDLKGVNNFYIPFILRKLKGEDVTDKDKLFIYEGLLCEVMDVPEINIPC